MTRQQYGGNASSGISGPKVTGVNLMDIAQRQAGLLTEVRTALSASIAGAAGLWALVIDTVPPQRSQKFYTLDPSGERIFSHWSMLADVGLRQAYSPYLSVQSCTGGLEASAGIKVVIMTLPSVIGYDGTGIGDTALDSALAQANARVPGLATSATTEMAPLPHVSLRYTWSDTLAARAAYGRNFAYPFHGPLYSKYATNTENFGNYGLTLSSLWGRQKLETSDAVDVGMSVRTPSFRVEPTLFYAWFHDKQVMVYDSAAEVSYYQSVASAQSVGAELELVATPASWLSAYAIGSFNRTWFNDNLRTKSSTPLQSAGKEFPDAPRWLGKLGFAARWQYWSLSPFLRYVSTRYGDLMNTERVEPYWVVDTELAYTIGRFGPIREWKASLRAENLLDRRYVGVIKNQQDVAEALSTAYYPGAPRTLSLSLSASLGGS